MNPNLPGSSQWRPLQPQQNEFGGASGGNLFHQQQQRPTRQITKNPQNISMGFQNFTPNGFGANGLSSPFGSGAGGGGSGNDGPLSPNLSGSASTGRLTGLMSPMSPNGGGGHGNMGNFDFMGGNNSSSNRQSDQTRLSPSFSTGLSAQPNRGSNLMNMPNPMSPRDMERHSMNNGFDPIRSPSVGQSPNSALSNGFRSNQSTNFDRSISVTNGMGGNGSSAVGNFFDQFKSNTNSNASNSQSEINNLLRQMSMPNGMPDHGGGGLGRGGGGGHGSPGMMNQNGFLRSSSNMSTISSLGSSTSIGGGLSNGSNRSDIFSGIGSGMSGSSNFNNGQEQGGLTMRNPSPPLGNSSFNGNGYMSDMKIGMWDGGSNSGSGQVKQLYSTIEYFWNLAKNHI